MSRFLGVLVCFLGSAFGAEPTGEYSITPNQPLTAAVIAQFVQGQECQITGELAWWYDKIHTDPVSQLSWSLAANKWEDCLKFALEVASRHDGVYQAMVESRQSHLKKNATVDLFFKWSYLKETNGMVTRYTARFENALNSGDRRYHRSGLRWEEPPKPTVQEKKPVAPNIVFVPVPEPGTPQLTLRLINPKLTLDHFKLMESTDGGKSFHDVDRPEAFFLTRKEADALVTKFSDEKRALMVDEMSPEEYVALTKSGNAKKNMTTDPQQENPSPPQAVVSVKPQVELPEQKSVPEYRAGIRAVNAAKLTPVNAEKAPDYFKVTASEDGKNFSNQSKSFLYFLTEQQAIQRAKDQTKGQHIERAEEMSYSEYVTKESNYGSKRMRYADFAFIEKIPLNKVKNSDGYLASREDFRRKYEVKKGKGETCKIKGWAGNTNAITEIRDYRWSAKRNTWQDCYQTAQELAMVSAEAGPSFFPVFFEWTFDSGKSEVTGLLSRGTGDFKLEPAPGDQRLWRDGSKWP